MTIWNKFRTRVKKYGFKYVFMIIMRNKIYSPIDRAILVIEKKLLERKKLQDTIIIESHNDFDSNGGAFYEYLIKEGYNRKYKIVWLLRNKKPDNLPENVTGYNMFRPGIMKNYYICTAKYMTSDHVITEKVRSEQISFYLTHGPVSLKASKGKIKFPASLDYALCPSEYLAPVIAGQHDPEEKAKRVILGYPMHDVFYNSDCGDLEKITKKKYRKVILWMPTFRTVVGFDRQDSYCELPMGIPIIENMEEYSQLNELLRQNNALLILKLHPMQDISHITIKSLSNIVVLDGGSVKKYGVNNYRLMKDTDALISDYSSAAYDYLHVGKPIAYTMDDAKDYKLGFIVNPPQKLMAGHIIYTKEDFIGFLQDIIAEKDPYKNERDALFDKVFKYHDGNSAARLAEFMGLNM